MTRLVPAAVGGAIGGLLGGLTGWGLTATIPALLPVPGPAFIVQTAGLEAAFGFFAGLLLAQDAGLTSGPMRRVAGGVIGAGVGAAIGLGLAVLEAVRGMDALAKVSEFAGLDVAAFLNQRGPVSGAVGGIAGAAVGALLGLTAREPPTAGLERLGNAYRPSILIAVLCVLILAGYVLVVKTLGGRDSWEFR
jgi:hypothetical protein